MGEGTLRKTVPTAAGPRSVEDMIFELFVVARSNRVDGENSWAEAEVDYKGERIVIRVTLAPMMRKP